jgi:hypothetical protein
MHRIIYTSNASAGVGAPEVFAIVEQSARNNPSADITGFLIYRAGTFLQLVEGPLASLEALLDKLRHDPRHHGLRVIERAPVPHRSFPRWRMKRIGDAGDAVAELESALAAEGHDLALPAVVADFLRRPLAA